MNIFFFLAGAQPVPSAISESSDISFGLALTVALLLFGIVSSLIGVIWAMLNSKINGIGRSLDREKDNTTSRIKDLHNKREDQVRDFANDIRTLEKELTDLYIKEKDRVK